MNYATALIQLPLVMETRRDRVRSPEEVARICEDIRNLAQESFHVLHLNAKNCLINRQLVTIGILDASLIHPREVFRLAIGMAASAIVVVHNHPSGDPTPSAEDIRITKQLIECGKILSIPVQDHVILGRQSESSPAYVSMRESGLCDFATA